jgi:septal ring factor EnvC (AmiA/AmiB activator)
MERTIEKKEHIRLGTVAMSGKKKKHYTQASLKKKIMTLKAQLKAHVNESKRVVQDISRQEEHNNKLYKELEEQQKVYSEIEDAKYQLSESINDGYFRKQMNLEQVLMYRKRKQRYQECIEGKLKINGTEERLESELLRCDEKFQKIKDVIGQLRAEAPKHDRFFSRLLSFA